MPSSDILTPVYCSSACNRCPHSLDWGNNNLLSYATCNSIALLDPKVEPIAVSVNETLVHHKGRINCVRWIRKANAAPEEELLSASVDKTAVIWRQKDGKFHPVLILGPHDGGVTVGDAMYLQKGQTVADDFSPLCIVTSSTDSTVRIWERMEGNVNCSQVINLGRGFALDVRICLLPKAEVPLLLLGGDDNKIHLYIRDANKVFMHARSLTGHEDWIRGISIAFMEGQIFLASCSQDQFIRIWKISPRLHGSEISENIISATGEIKVKEELFYAVNKDQKYAFAVSLDSVLAGHENWVYSVQWQPQIIKDGSFVQNQRLLSSSVDKTMILWELNNEAGIWLEKVRVGEVGGNTLGFYGGAFSPDGKSILGHGYQGALHLWNYDMNDDTWKPGVITSGHFDEVQSIDWDPEGEFVLSCSSDQTTRLHAPWVHSDGQVSWHEIARPQVHGYDMKCLAVVQRYKFVSGADEKVLRVFEAPRNFLENFGNICKQDTKADIKRVEEVDLPEGASVPSLGLSNKAVFEQDLENMKNSKTNHPKDQYPEAYFVPIVMSVPPTEETLLQNTLWPETKKLYGHGYEIFAVASNHAGTIVASACKASKTEHAAIILWDTATWTQMGQLISHSLTVTELAFSPSDEYLLSVSRDRTWSLFNRSDKESIPYKRIACTNKSTGIHTRIIWSCSWSHDSLYFATVSRDKKAIIWGKQDADNSSETFGAVSSVLELQDSITAVDFAPLLSNLKKYVLAFGLESGCILLYTWHSTSEWVMCCQVPEHSSHCLTVKRLRFSPQAGQAGHRSQGKKNDVIQLASCSSDHQVRLFNINLSLI